MTIDDFPDDRPNCGNCTRQGGVCPRTSKNKQIHNGIIFGATGQPAGIIYGCPHYTGRFKPVKNNPQ